MTDIRPPPTIDNWLLFDRLTLKSITTQRLLLVSAFPGVHSIKPRCIKCQAGKVLEIIVWEDLGTLSGSSFALTPSTKKLTFRNIEQWYELHSVRNTSDMSNVKGRELIDMLFTFVIRAAMIFPEDTLLRGSFHQQYAH